MFYKIAVAALGITMLAGCATVPTQDQNATNEVLQFKAPAENMAALYLFRDSFIGQGLYKDLYVDGVCVGETGPYTFFYKEVEGNKNHIISTESEFSPNSIKLYTEAGKRYFIRQAIKFGIFVGRSDLELIDEIEGRQALLELKLAVPGTCSSVPPTEEQLRDEGLL